MSLIIKISSENDGQPNTKITTIGDYAFEGCQSAKILKLPNTLEEMKYASFSGCTSLKELDLSTTKVNLISEGAFSSASKLKIIRFSEAVPTINVSAFSIFYAPKVDTMVLGTLTAEDIGYTGNDDIWNGRTVTIAEDYYTVFFGGKKWKRNQ